MKGNAGGSDPKKFYINKPPKKPKKAKEPKKQKIPKKPKSEGQKILKKDLAKVKKIEEYGILINPETKKVYSEDSKRLITPKNGMYHIYRLGQPQLKVEADKIDKLFV